jgi:hypothetical protein
MRRQLRSSPFDIGRRNRPASPLFSADHPFPDPIALHSQPRITLNMSKMKGKKSPYKKQEDTTAGDEEDLSTLRSRITAYAPERGEAKAKAPFDSMPLSAITRRALREANLMVTTGRSTSADCFALSGGVQQVADSRGQSV